MSGKRAALNIVSDLSSAHVPIPARRLEAVEPADRMPPASEDRTVLFPSLQPKQKTDMVSETFRLPLDQAKQVRKICKAADIEKSQFFRDCVAAGLQHLSRERETA